MSKKLLLLFTIILPATIGYSQSRSVVKLLKSQTSEKYIEVEAEDFVSQDLTKNKSWYITSSKKTKKIKPDPDKKHLSGASGGSYIEVLPETFYGKKRVMSEGVNFSKYPGKVAILNYNINFETAGKYYVWIRGYSSSTLDNSIHAGINDRWSDSGTAIYFCEQNNWVWSSSLRKDTDNCDDNAEQAYINVFKPGKHTVQFSMREDGFEFDKWILTTDKNFVPE